MGWVGRAKFMKSGFAPCCRLLFQKSRIEISQPIIPPLHSTIGIDQVNSINHVIHSHEYNEACRRSQEQIVPIFEIIWSSLPHAKAADPPSSVIFLSRVGSQIEHNLRDRCLPGNEGRLLTSKWSFSLGGIQLSQKCKRMKSAPFGGGARFWRGEAACHGRTILERTRDQLHCLLLF